jgi:hypothetical protein
MPGGSEGVLTQLLRLRKIRGSLIRGRTAGNNEEKNQTKKETPLKIGAHTHSLTTIVRSSIRLRSPIFSG